MAALRRGIRFISSIRWTFMKCRVAAIVSALFILSVVLAAVPAADDTAEAASDLGAVTVYGYVGESKGTAAVLFDGVTVGLMDSDMEVFQSFSTGSAGNAGMFEFTYQNGKAAYVQFSHSGYAVGSFPTTLTATSVPGVLMFDLSKLTPDEDGRYNLTGGSMVIMEGSSTVNIHGHVTYGESKAVDGASIVLTSSSGRTYDATTDKEGYFEIAVLLGTYSLDVECKGFEPVTTRAVSTDSPNVNVYLTEKDHTVIFGLDMAHAMELLGLLTTLLVVIIVLISFALQKRGKGVINMVNDLEEKDRSDRKG
jgi:hypothetical protein